MKLSYILKKAAQKADQKGICIADNCNNNLPGKITIFIDDIIGNPSSDYTIIIEKVKNGKNNKI